MDIAEILRHILIVLVAAKVAAEVAERVGIPAVVGEIVAGILVGPSVLNAVGGNDEVLRTLGEIGVILLLLDVGMEMDLRELGKVGRTSLLVATIGVVAPMVLGIGAMQLMGEDGKTALFVGAALTATSVGITARVFGDLRALATREARIVLGAAVADDVMGLIVLTVVVRLVTEGSVSVLSVAGIIGVALLFLVVGGLVGLRVAPPLFAAIERVSRSTGTLVALALAFTLAFAELADLAKLAPIVGAFVAGIALTRTRESPRIRRELGPVGHLFIPVFFLQIGIDADVGRFFDGRVLLDAGILLVAAVVGKLLSPLGAIGAAGDKPLIGLGMLPRGEVGLIFATLGLQNGVLGEDLYAALLLVVLVTTLVAPQLLKVRYAKLRGATRPVTTPADAPTPDGGWLAVSADQVHVTSRPPDHLAPMLGLDAAIALARRRPTDDLLAWLDDAEPVPTWTPELTDKLLDVIERGNARSWRFVELSHLFDRALPELADALRTRRRDGFSLDPLDHHRFESMERLRMLDGDDPVAQELRQLAEIDHLFLATFLAEAFEDDLDPEASVVVTLTKLRLPEADRRAVLELFHDRDLLWSAAHRPGGLGEEPVLQLAAHLDDPDRARALYALSALRAPDPERWEMERLRTLHELVQAALADDELVGSDARTIVEARRLRAGELAGDSPGARQRLELAPRAYVLRTPPEALARHAVLLDPVPATRPRLRVLPADDRWWLDVAWHDRPGLLAGLTHALAKIEMAVDDAVLATWPDGAVLDSFLVRAKGPIDEAALLAAIETATAAPLASMPLPEAEVDVDHHASPWHTICEVRCPDRPGLLAALATAFAAAGIEVRSAHATLADDLAIDRFEVTDRAGAKLGPDHEERLRQLVRAGVTVRRRRLGRGLAVKALA
ncbi:MAG: cation:proton antiporter [Acidimicrobiales bacterium]|nr:cation:proton antiporter [Acidimicrobiales bacterium]